MTIDSQIVVDLVVINYVRLELHPLREGLAT